MSYIGNKPTAVPLTSADLEDNIISTAKIQDNAVTAAKYVEYPAYRNLIINGDMSIAQRATSFTGLTNGSSEYTLDRFKFIESGSPTSVFTVSQESTAPDGFSNSLKIACTTSGSGHNVIEIIQSIEAQNLKSLAFGTSSAKSFTLSFWVKSNQTGTGTVSFYNLDALRQRAENYTINVADTWEYKTITVSGDTSGAFNNDNGIGLTVYFPIAASVSYNGGSTGSWGSYSDGKRGAGMTIDLTTSTSDYLQITGVQLEVGTSASDFEFLPYDVNLQRCQRYYHQIGYGLNGASNEVNIGQGQWYNSSEVLSTVYFPTSMRTAPSMTSPTVSGGYRFHSAGSFVDANDGGSINRPSNMMTGIFKNGLSGGGGGQASFINAMLSGASYKFDAEL